MASEADSSRVQAPHVSTDGFSKQVAVWHLLSRSERNRFTRFDVLSYLPGKQPGVTNLLTSRCAAGEQVEGADCRHKESDSGEAVGNCRHQQYLQGVTL